MPLYVTRNPPYVSGPTQVTANQTTQDHHAVLPSLGPPKEPGDKTAPESSIGKKQKVVETMGPIHKIGPVVPKFYQDHRGKLVASLSENLSTASSWEDFIKTHQGKSYLAPDIDHIQHSTRGLLQSFRDKGVLVPMDNPPWTSQTID